MKNNNSSGGIGFTRFINNSLYSFKAIKSYKLVLDMGFKPNMD